MLMLVRYVLFNVEGSRVVYGKHKVTLSLLLRRRLVVIWIVVLDDDGMRNEKENACENRIMRATTTRKTASGTNQRTGIQFWARGDAHFIWVTNHES
jgi:hypothetical protein